MVPWIVRCGLELGCMPTPRAHVQAGHGDSAAHPRTASSNGPTPARTALLQPRPHADDTHQTKLTHRGPPPTFFNCRQPVPPNMPIECPHTCAHICVLRSLHACAGALDIACARQEPSRKGRCWQGHPPPRPLVSCFLTAHASFAQPGLASHSLSGLVTATWSTRPGLVWSDHSSV
jgi:hypothetical protein